MMDMDQSMPRSRPAVLNEILSSTSFVRVLLQPVIRHAFISTDREMGFNRTSMHRIRATTQTRWVLDVDRFAFVLDVDRSDS